VVSPVVPSVAVVAHDAGGAEILSSYVKEKALNGLYVIAGPAIKIFTQKVGPVMPMSLQSALRKCDWVLTGTGSSDFEWQAIRQAREAGKKTVAYLDHWVNYEGRFTKHGILAYPDEIWVGDSDAYKLAKLAFVDINIKLVKNPHFKQFTEAVKRLDRLATKDNKRQALFVSENIDRREFHQNDAIRFFMENLDCLSDEIDHVLIRPHPTENVEKYFWVRSEFGGLVSFSAGATLIEEIAASDIVLGCNTMAMVLALLSNRRVISCIPVKSVPMILPFEKIELLSTILERRK
jgi:hypothetical protein